MTTKFTKRELAAINQYMELQRTNPIMFESIKNNLLSIVNKTKNVKQTIQPNSAN